MLYRAEDQVPGPIRFVTYEIKKKSGISPMGMIFIPCYKGYSHKPEEYASTQDIANGVKVLALTLAKLSLR
ncbi:Peptidase M20 - like 7 [Theobroma cacao]|nr:Peptidase M20 - like 7 [Theobroma cacao]